MTPSFSERHITYYRIPNMMDLQNWTTRGDDLDNLSNGTPFSSGVRSHQHPFKVECARERERETGQKRIGYHAGSSPLSPLLFPQHLTRLCIVCRSSRPWSSPISRPRQSVYCANLQFLPLSPTSTSVASQFNPIVHPLVNHYVDCCSTT